MQAVIFDLDGTLLDTAKDLAAAVNYALAKHTLPTHTTQEVLDMVGNGVYVLIDLATPSSLTPAEKTAVLEDFRAYYMKHMGDCTQEFSGLGDVIEELRAHGIKLAVVSNKPDAATKALVSAYFLDAFLFVQGQLEEVPRKPNPESTAMALAKLGVAPEDAIFVGDSETDVACARAAEVPFVGVSWGFRTRQQLKEAGATQIVDTPEELRSFLKKLRS